MPCEVIQDREIMVERSDRIWSTGEGNGKPLQYSCLENPKNSMKRQKDVTFSSFNEDLQGLPELTPKKDVLFIIGDWNAKVGSQETPGVTGKFGLGIQNKVGQRLIEFCQENTLVIANTLFQKHKRKLYTWISPDSQHQNQIDYIVFSQRWRSSTVSKYKTRT